MWPGRPAMAFAIAAAGLLAFAPSHSQAASRPRAPVVMVLFDELPTTSLLARGGRIDAHRYPNFAALARAATWYSNATTVSDATSFAIPSILDGRRPRRDVRPTASAHPRNLFTLLRRRGYRLQVEEEATDLCPYSSCRRRRSARYFLSHRRLDRFREWVRRIGPGTRPTLFFKHTLLPHVPWVFLPSGQRYDRTVIGPIRGLTASDVSVFDPTLVRQAWQRHLLQTGAVDTLLGELVARLRATGLYDRAILVVVADHGVSFRHGVTDRRTIVPANAPDIASVPLFVKYPRQRRGRIDRGLVRTYDVLPTIAAAIGLRLPRGLAGRPASSRAIDRRNRITVLSRSRMGEVTIARRRLPVLKRQALSRQLALFGWGRRTLFDFGPNRSLRGRPVGELRVVAGGRLRGTLNEESGYERIRPEAGFLRVHVTGRILGGAARSRRDIAVAVDGVIRGVTRSVRIRGDRAEYYSVLVDPRALHRGRNEIQVFAVSRRRAAWALRRLYRSPPPPQS